MLIDLLLATFTLFTAMALSWIVKQSGAPELFWMGLGVLGLPALLGVLIFTGDDHAPLLRRHPEPRR